MEKIHKSSKNLLILVAGLILILAGVAGFFLLMHQGENDPTKAAYFAAETAAALSTPTSARTIIQQQTPDELASGTLVPVNGPYLDFNKYLVEVNPNSPLENPYIPDRIVIPTIRLDAPVVVADFNFTNVEGETFGQWLAPSKYAAGWQPDSATLGIVGNTVINGHHNEYGKVFENLVNLNIGDEIDVYSGNKKFAFVVANKLRFLELTQDLQTRLDNARWLARSNDVRLTLVTCWPPLSNTYRIVIVASPLK